MMGRLNPQPSHVGSWFQAVKGWVILRSSNWPEKGFMKGFSIAPITFSGNSYPKGDDLS